MRVALIAMMILLLPAALFAGPTMGVYFTYVPGAMVWNPDVPPIPGAIEAFIYAHNTACYLNAAEFALEIPPGVIIFSYAPPVGALQLGSLPAGLSVAYWPPMDGWNPGYNLLCSMTLWALDGCAFYGRGGTLSNLPLRVIPHPDTGLIQGSCWPENYLFEYTGMTSIICLDPVGVQETNWSAIKSLF
jgi:hypothetical protein